MKNSPEEIEKGLIHTNIKLQSEIDKFPKFINDKAETNRVYRIAIAKKLMQLRSEGIPVTVAKDIARGDKIVAEMKFNSSKAEDFFEMQKFVVRALLASINSYQTMSAMRRVEYEKANIAEG